jgi:hypothetical protein
MGEESEYAYLATIDALKQANLDETFWIPMKWEFYGK